MLLLVGLGPTMDFSYILGRVWSNRVNASYLSTVILGNRMIKYADDTYIVIPAGNIQSRVIEFEHVADWAQKNNLKLSRAKSVVIVINDIRKKVSLHRSTDSARHMPSNFHQSAWCHLHQPFVCQ